jgi:PadR family transcriptional regulator AphA
MATGTPSLRYNVLGLLAQEPMSGYDIKRLFKDLSWLIGSPSAGSLYPILRALLEEERVTVQVVPSAERPPRKIYSLTEAGRQELQAWAEQPIAPDTSLKAFVMHLLLSKPVSPARLIAHLRQRRAQVAARRVDLEQSLERLEEGTELGRRLTLEYGLALAKAELAWLGETLVQLSEQPPPEANRRSGG